MTAVDANGTAAHAAPADACPARSLPPTDLTDLDPTHGDAVRCLSWYGVVQGYDAATFGSTDTTNRGQAASLVVRTLERAGVDLDREGAPTFTDVEGNVHREAIERLAAADVFRGTGDGQARPLAPVSRAQLASLLVRAVEHTEGADLPVGEADFDDLDVPGHTTAIRRAATAGIVQGDGTGSFRPAEPITRAQVASVLARTLDRFVQDQRLRPPADPELRWEVETLPAWLRDEMQGVSWEPGCPVGLDDLRLVVLTHRGFDDRLHRGELVVHHTAVDPLEHVFEELYAADFPLQRVERIEAYGGDDDAAMAANASHAFNCRTITGGDSWSEHSYGWAIDLNPRQNPYVRDGTVLPPEGEAYLDRDDVRPGMIVEGDVVVSAFDDIDWGWGGRWDSLVDHMHFSETGR